MKFERKHTCHWKGYNRAKIECVQSESRDNCEDVKMILLSSNNDTNSLITFVTPTNLKSTSKFTYFFFHSKILSKINK